LNLFPFSVGQADYGAKVRMTLIRSLQPRVRLSLVPWSRPPDANGSRRRGEDCCVVDPEALGDGSGALASLKPAPGFLTLVVGQLGFAAELDTLGLGSRAAVVGALHNALALVLGHSTQEGNEAPAQRCGQVQMRLV